VACIYANSQSIFEALPGAVNAQRRNGRSPADYDKNCNISQKRLDEQRQTTREVLNKVLRRVLYPPTFKQNPSAKSGYYNVPCADGNFRCCKPVLAKWRADCPEYSDLHHLEWQDCCWCECPKIELGDYVPPGNQHPRRDHNLNRTLSDARTKAANAERSSRDVHRGFNMFRHIPCILSDLPSLTSSIQCRSACVITSRSAFSTS